MTLRDQLLLTSDAYCAFTGMSRSRLSTILLSGGKRLDMIRAGGDIGTARYESAMLWLSENWPSDLRWPEGVPRPVADACREAAE
jgi:hypothetical protein